jgi:hypothetical protein
MPFKVTKEQQKIYTFAAFFKRVLIYRQNIADHLDK